MFLKYLIDFDYHQGLWNILAILGDHFYVLNDIEKKSDPIKIHLSNDLSTNYGWQIEVVGIN